MKAIFGMRANVLASIIFSVSTLAAGVFAASLLAQGIAAAQTYPVRPFQKSEIEKWWPIIKAAHITAE